MKNKDITYKDHQSGVPKGSYGYIEMGIVNSGENIHEFVFTSYDADTFKPKLNMFRRYSDYLMCKERLCFTAINNLLRQINFLELNQSLLTSDISESEFEKEIENNENKYSIPLMEHTGVDVADLGVICELVSRIDPSIKEFSHNEVAELFSVNPSVLPRTFTPVKHNPQLTP
jgi:hypothetical protein